MRSACEVAEWINLPLADVHEQWAVVRTYSNHERRVARGLRDDGLFCYIPGEKVRRVLPDGRREEFWRPLWTGYVFVNSDALSYDCRKNPKVRGSLLTIEIITPGAQKQLDRELRVVEVAEMADAFSSIDYQKFVVERSFCRVRRGPLEGIRGKLIRKNDNTLRFTLQVSILGLHRELEIPMEDLELESFCVA